MERLLKVADLRDLESQVLKGKISYSRMVEIINEKHFLALVNLRMELSPTKDKNHNLKAEKQHYEAPVSGKDALKDMPVTTTMEEYFKLTPVSEKPEKEDYWYHTFRGNALIEDLSWYDSVNGWDQQDVRFWLKPCSNPYKAEIEKLVEEMKSEDEEIRNKYHNQKPDSAEYWYWKARVEQHKFDINKLTSLLKTIS